MYCFGATSWDEYVSHFLQRGQRTGAVFKLRRERWKSKKTRLFDWNALWKLKCLLFFTNFFWFLFCALLWPLLLLLLLLLLAQGMVGSATGCSPSSRHSQCRTHTNTRTHAHTIRGRQPKMPASTATATATRRASWYMRIREIPRTASKEISFQIMFFRLNPPHAPCHCKAGQSFKATVHTRTHAHILQLDRAFVGVTTAR